MSKLSLQLTILFIIIWLKGYTNLQQSANYHFQYLKVEDGLPQNTINAIAKDAFGFMWFGTNNGICRFDGYSFETFKSDKNNSNSLPDNMISSIEPGFDNNIWIGSSNGLSYYDPYADLIYNYTVAETGCQDIQKVTSILADGDKLWIGTSTNGLFLLTPNKDGNLRISSHFIRNNHSIGTNNITVISKNHTNTVVVGTNEGIFTYQPQHNIFEKKSNYGQLLENAFINDIFESNKGELFVATSIGLAFLGHNMQQPVMYTNNPADETSLAHNTVNKISENAQGEILVASLGGLQKFDPSTGLFYSFPEIGPDYYKLNNQFINTLFCDKAGNVWIGTEKGGINKFNVFQNQFGYYTHDPNNKNSLNENTINSIFKEKDYLWIGTAGGGLNMVDLKSGTINHYVFNVFNQRSISSDYITSFIRDNSDMLWVGTWGGGLNRLTTLGSSVSIERITAGSSGASNTLVNSFISSLVYDGNKLVIGTEGGLSTYNTLLRRFTTYTTPINNNPPLSEIGCLLKDSKGYYWVGTRNGLFRFHSSSLIETEEPTVQIDKIQFFRNEPGNQHSIPGNYVISLLEDSKGNIWVGTYGNGLCKCTFDQNGNIQCATISQADGLPNNVIYGILEDDFGNLWISTDYGLACYNLSTKKIRNFFKQDGLLNNQFYWSASFKSDEGILYFGGTEGLNYFKPEHVLEYKHLATPKVTRLKIFNQEIRSGEISHGKVVIRKPVFSADTILLSYRDNNISLDFSALDFYLPEKTVFAYMIPEIDKDWIYVPAQRRFANYSNLKGGSYHFLLKASNCDGIWNEKPTEITIIITPPFWKTKWFTILSIIFVLSVSFFIIQYQLKRIIDQKRVLEEKVILRTQKIEDQKIMLEKQANDLIESNQKLERRQILIEQQKKELEDKNNEISSQRDELILLNNKVREINQKQLSFFTNISHEFRTPLTLIISPLERLIDKFKNDNETENILKILNRNAQRLLLLINQLLEIRKIETGNQELRVELTDVKAFLLEIFNSFNELARKNEILYTCNFSITDETWIDKEKIENVTYNLLSNAFKFTPKGGKISLSVRTKKIDENLFLKISVSDSGIGISPDQIGRLFDRFYQVTESKNHKHAGTGIGLSLVKSLAEIMYGKVEAQSEPGKGSNFSVSIPVNNQFFANHEIDTSGQVYESDIQSKVAILYDQIIETPHAHHPHLIDREIPSILVIEDNPDMRQYICSNLSRFFNVLEAENGKQGLEAAKKEEPDLIISDIMMPEMDGLELCRKIKTNLYTSHIPLILLTAKGEVEDYVEGLEQGADDYISKPFNIEILIAKVSGMIENRKKLRKKYSSLEDVSPTELTTSKLDEQFFIKIGEIVELNYIDPDFDVDKFASLMLVSRSQLYKKMKAITDLSTIDFLNVFRLKKSVDLLKQGDLQISEIAYSTGFNDPKYFSRIFKKYYHCTPSEYVSKNKV
jgi:signal transduction histidine kinase/ligand-binding sensor domain-containing protein/CheY-like chemotaxis protein